MHPENLLLASADDDTSIKLAGFGLAGSVRAGRLRDPWGTPGYKAPEILRGNFYGTVSEALDLRGNNAYEVKRRGTCFICML